MQTVRVASRTSLLATPTRFILMSQCLIVIVWAIRVQINSLGPSGHERVRESKLLWSFDQMLPIAFLSFIKPRAWGCLGASADQTAQVSFSLRNPLCQIKRWQSILRAHILSFCHPCCPSSRLFLFNVVRSCFLFSLGASWGRFWTSKMTLRTSKTLILAKTLIDF